MIQPNFVWLVSVLMAGVTAYVEPEGLLPGSTRPDLIITSLGDAEKEMWLLM